MPEDRPSRRSAKAKRVDDELLETLHTMLEEDVDITGRKVAERMSSVADSSSFSTMPWRGAKIQKAKVEQARRRELAAKGGHPSRDRLLAEIAVLKQKNQALDRDRQILLATIPAMLRALMESGSMPRLRSFYKEYEKTLDRLTELGVFPSADLLPMHPPLADTPRLVHPTAASAKRQKA